MHNLHWVVLSTFLHFGTWLINVTMVSYEVKLANVSFKNHEEQEIYTVFNYLLLVRYPFKPRNRFSVFCLSLL